MSLSILLILGLGLSHAAPIDPIVTRNFTFLDLDLDHNYSTTEKVIFPKGITLTRRFNGNHIPMGIQLSWRSNLIWSGFECRANCTIWSKSWFITLDPMSSSIWYNLPEGKGVLTGTIGYAISTAKPGKSKRHGRTPVSFVNPMVPSQQASLSIPLFVGCSLGFLIIFAAILIMVRVRKDRTNYYLPV